MEEEGEGIKRSQECVVLVMIEMVSAGLVTIMMLLLMMMMITIMISIVIMIMMEPEHGPQSAQSKSYMCKCRLNSSAFQGLKVK